jgi:hypothetical protein
MNMKTADENFSESAHLAFRGMAVQAALRCSVSTPLPTRRKTLEDGKRENEVWEAPANALTCGPCQ